MQAYVRTCIYWCQGKVVASQSSIKVQTHTSSLELIQSRESAYSPLDHQQECEFANS